MNIYESLKNYAKFSQTSSDVGGGRRGRIWGGGGGGCKVRVCVPVNVVLDQQSRSWRWQHLQTGAGGRTGWGQEKPTVFVCCYPVVIPKKQEKMFYIM